MSPDRRTFLKRSTAVVSVVMIAKGERLSGANPGPAHRPASRRRPGSCARLARVGPLVWSTSRALPMNFEDRIYVESPKRIYDAFILIPTAHRTLPP